MRRFAFIAAAFAALALSTPDEAQAQSAMLADTSQFSDCIWNSLDADAHAAVLAAVPRLRDMAPQVQSLAPFVEGCGGDGSQRALVIVVDVVAANSFMLRGAQELAARGTNAETLARVWDELSPGDRNIFSHVTDGSGRATPELRDRIHARCDSLGLRADADCTWLSIYLIGRATYDRLHTPGGYL